MKSRVYFADSELKKSLEDLEKSNPEGYGLYKMIKRAIEDLSQNAFCGIQVPKKLIPKEYIKKYGIDNLWKYNLPNAWRLLYSVSSTGVELVSIIIEWCDHKDYERKFNY